MVAYDRIFFMTMFKMVSLFQGYAGLFPAWVILFLSLQEKIKFLDVGATPRLPG